MNPKNQKFLKTDVPIARYSIAKYCPPFFSNNEIDESVGNLFCASRAAESKKPKIFKNGRSYRPLFNLQSIAPLFFQTTRQTKVLGTFFVRLERLNPKNQKFLKTDVPIARYSIAKYCPPFFSNNEIDESVENLFCASRTYESKKPKIFKNGRSYRPLFNCKVLPPFFFQTTRQTKVLETFFVRLEQMNPKNQKFLKTDVPIARYSIAKYCPPFFSNNEIDESVGNLFCASQTDESKKPKIFKNGRSYRPLFNLQSIAPLFFQTTRQTKVLGNFFVRLEHMNPKNQKFLKTDVPIARYSIAKYCPPFFFKQRDRRKCWESFLCVSNI